MCGSARVTGWRVGLERGSTKDCRSPIVGVDEGGRAMKRTFTSSMLALIVHFAFFAIATRMLQPPHARPGSEPQVYGDTPEELVPYGRFTEPYKTFFLEPNEYRGYGRHIPEPEHVDERQDRLPRSDRGHRLGSDRRCVARRTAGSQDAAGGAARDRTRQRPWRLPRFEETVRAGCPQRQRSMGGEWQRDSRPRLQGKRVGDPGDHRRRQLPHRDPCRPQGRGADDEHGRHRPDIHRDRHSVGLPQHHR